MSDLLATGEFSLADKLQPPEYLQGRTGALQRLHKLDPRLAAEIISYAWPHPAGRVWTDDELYERLGTPKRSRAKVAESADVLARYGIQALKWGGGAAAILSLAPDLLKMHRHGVLHVLKTQDPQLEGLRWTGVGASLLGQVLEHQAKKRFEETSEVRDASMKAASTYLGKFAEGFVDSYMPSVGAAFDAFHLERARQNALSAAEDQFRYPALHFTQPVMAQYAMGGGPSPAPAGGSHHHRRHRHHTG